MTNLNFSISFIIEADDIAIKQAANHLDQRLTDQIKDLIAQTLGDLDFDIRQRYSLVRLDIQEEAKKKAGSPRTVPIWSTEKNTFLEIKIGSPEWFSLMAQERKFKYFYESLIFTVRFETRKSKGKEYSYWRAYATVNGQLLTRQIGTTKNLTQENLDAAGAYFSNQ